MKTYKDGLLQAAEIVVGDSWEDAYLSDLENNKMMVEHIADAIRAEAAAPEPPVVIDGTPSSGLDRELLKQIKTLCLTMGAPGHITVPDGLSRIVRICLDMGITEKVI